MNRPQQSKSGTRTSRRSTSAPRRSPGRDHSAAVAPRADGEHEGPRASPREPSGGYGIPVALGLLTLIALFVYFRPRQRVPAEPPQPAADTSAPGAAPLAPSEPSTPPPIQLDRPPQGAAPPPEPGSVAQNVAVVPTHPRPTSPDPLHGEFSLTQATAGMPPGTSLVAEIESSMGSFTCQLLPREAPITVANFVGLARGVRDFWDPVAGTWTRRPFYDGSVFHRVIPDFMVQGGDILRSGSGDTGYEIRDENVVDHNAGGLLCMANHGPNTGSGQFFITEIGKPHLNGSYSVFGRCTPVDLVARIARVPRTPRDQPITPVRIEHVRIRR